MEFDTDVRIADFVEQRFTGMNENYIQMEHDINTADRRLENMEDSPRKHAADLLMNSNVLTDITVDNLRSFWTVNRRCLYFQRRKRENPETIICAE